MKISTLTISCLALLGLLLTACGGSTPPPPTPTATVVPTATLRPSPTPTALPTAQPTPSVLPPDPQRIEFQAADGTRLVGYYYPAAVKPAPVIVLMHQLGTTQQDWVTRGLVHWLQNRGRDGGALTAPAKGIYPPLPAGTSFAVFTFDFRGMGESLPAMPERMTGDEFNQWVAGWLSDAQAAVAQARALPDVDPDRLALIGASIGADAAVDVCDVGCLGALSLSPGSYLNISYPEAVQKVDGAGKPTRCLASEGDTDSAEACRAAQGAHYQAFVYPGKDHGMWLLKAGLDPDVGQVLLEFLKTAFGF